MHSDIFYDPEDRVHIEVKNGEAHLEDTYRHKAMRRKLVESIQAKGIRDARVLKAIRMLPRHFFLDKAFEEKAYQDNPFPIGNDQTISQPYTVAYQTELLKVRKGDKILEIGTGSGYQATILSMLGAKVHTIERQEELYLAAKRIIQRLAIPSIKFYFKDGYEGLSHRAPFDKIIVTAGAPKIPEKLLKQLSIQGWMVVPVGVQVQKMMLITRLGENEFREEKLDDFRFVPFLKGTVKK